VKTLYFAKPKLIFKNIAHYKATSTYIHVQIPFNFSQILDTKNTIQKSRSTPWTGLENWQNSLAGPTPRASTLPFKVSGQNTTDSLTKVSCLKELDQIRPAEMHLTFTSPAANALVIFLISMLIWKKCFSKSNTAESPLLAPSAPPMLASAQPQRHIKTPI
jgi:hypothetical protein